MHLVINDINNLTDLDRQVLTALVGGSAFADPAPAAAVPAETKVKKTAAAPKASAAPKPEPTPAPAPAPDPEPAPEPAEEDVLGDAAPAATMEDAVKRATELVAVGKAADVRAVLGELGVKRVSELKGDAVGAFVTALA